MRTRNASFRVCCKFFFAAAHARLLLSVPAPAPHCCARVSAAQMCGRTSAPDAIAGAHNARLRSCAAKLALALAPAQTSLQLCAQMGSVQYGVWGLLLRALQRSSASAQPGPAQSGLAYLACLAHTHAHTSPRARPALFIYTQQHQRLACYPGAGRNDLTASSDDRARCDTIYCYRTNSDTVLLRY